MMNLESAEQRCLSYLKQAANPLVPVSTLLRHVQAQEECGAITPPDLLDFLRGHELFRVIEPLGFTEGSDDLGLPAEPYAILCTREPTGKELNVLLYEQLESMRGALSLALEEAQLSGKTTLEGSVRDALRKVEDFRGKFQQELQGPPTPQ